MLTADINRTNFFSTLHVAERNAKAAKAEEPEEDWGLRRRWLFTEERLG